MRTASLNHVQANTFAILITALKIIIPLLVLLYGFFHFSPAHWLIIGMVAVATLALSYKVSRIAPSHDVAISGKTHVIHSDGGTFRHAEKTSHGSGNGLVVYDGGIIKSRMKRSA